MCHAISQHDTLLHHYESALGVVANGSNVASGHESACCGWLCRLSHGDVVVVAC